MVLQGVFPYLFLGAHSRQGSESGRLSLIACGVSVFHNLKACRSGIPGFRQDYFLSVGFAVSGRFSIFPE